MTALLSVEGLDAFYGASQILRHINLQMHFGEQIALMGRNGMGKTTLLRSLIGLVEDRRGRIVLKGHDVTHVATEQIAQMGVALVPEGRGVFGSLTVLENLLMAARAGGSNDRKTWTLDIVFDLFPRLAERRHHGGHQLSGGEQQMLAIGRALMTNPDLILIDEATEGLAPAIAQEIWRILGIMRDEGIAAIIVDKDIASMSGLVDRVVILSKGTIAFEDTPRGLQKNPEIIEQYFSIGATKVTRGDAGPDFFATNPKGNIGGIV